MNVTEFAYHAGLVQNFENTQKKKQPLFVKLMMTCKFSCFLFFILIMFVGCPITEKQPIETPEDKESLFLDAQAQKDFEAAINGKIPQCVRYIEGYAEGDHMHDVKDRFFELAKAGTYEDCEKFIELLPLIIRGATDERNFVKKAVNWALRNIGKRNLILY